MKYGILPIRHANARYQAEVSTLAEKELLLLLQACGLAPNAQWMTLSGVELITFEADALTQEQADILSDHSPSPIAKTEGKHLSPEKHNYRHYGTKLYDHKKHFLKGITHIKLYKFIHKEHMPCAGYRKPLCYALNYT